MKNNSSDVYLGIQALRFIAALMVVLTHSTFYAHERLTPELVIWQNGAAGVDIFFVISGLVMYASSSHLRTAHRGWIEFAARRIIRIVPLYWIITSFKLFILIFGAGLVLHSKMDINYIVKSYFFIPAYNPEGRIEPLLGVGWTLIFEMFFYLLFCITLAMKSGILRTLSVTLVICAAISLVKKPDWPAWSIYADMRVLEFLAGMLIASRLRGDSNPIFATLAVIAGFFTILLIDNPSNPIETLFFRVVPSAGIVYGVASMEPLLKPYVPKWAIFLGTASYSLYLIHPVIAPASPVILQRLGIHNSLISVLGSLAIALVGAVLAYKLLEKPITRLLTARTSQLWRVNPAPHARPTRSPAQ